MYLFLGLVALVGLTLYVATLSYVLRSYSPSLVGERLPESTREAWLAWLGQHAGALQLATGFARTLLIFTIMLAGCVWYLIRSDGVIAYDAAVLPSLTVLAVLTLFAVGLPHAIATHAGESLLAVSLYPLAVLRIALWPVTQVLLGLNFVVRRLLGEAVPDREEDAELEILDAVSEGELRGAVDEEQKEMIQSVIRLNQTTVSTIMTPRTDILAIDVEATHEDALKAMIDSAHSRIPVYEGTLDHIIGVLYAKDMLKLRPGDAFDARKMMRVAPYVPTTKTIDELLSEFRTTKVQIAIVLDEYGGTAGIVTLEDILEELVGEIDDEYDQPASPQIRRVGEDTLEVDARVHVKEINEELGIAIPEDGDYETIGGFVCTMLGKIPSAGEQLMHENARFVVLDAEPRKINRLRIQVMREAAAAS